MAVERPIVHLHTSSSEKKMSGFFPNEEDSRRGLQPGEASPVSDWEELEDEYGGEADCAFELSCKVCSSQPTFTVRACPVSLLSEEGVSLFSSDCVLPAVDILESTKHKINSCDCEICHTVCHWCKNLLGYKVVEPCQECLSGNNNGHYFMFSSPYLNAQHRMGEPYLTWFGSWSFGGDDDSYRRSIESFQKEKISKEEDFSRKQFLRSQKLYADLIIFSQCRTHVDDINERLMNIFSHFEQHPDLAICSKHQFIHVCKAIKKSNRSITWKKQMATAFGKALAAFKRAEKLASQNSLEMPSGSRSAIERNDDDAENLLWWAAMD